ncbi:BQ2448_4024 [Microbotryum intermedium]|uniref:nicotinamidase n=1 Tax=Microbotryum intermedium TaxID=269621 RepID=A0A238FGY6_9BASI|nr:BQ2448_4024 [Microbotryum intermedium]
MTRVALLLVDVQYDFLDRPTPGALAVPGGHEILPHVHRLLDTGDWQLVIASQDFHPSNHISFASRHGREPFTKLVVPRPPSHEEHQQELWPDHCVQGTRGCEIEQGVQQRLDAWPGPKVVVQKGTDENLDAYSAFAIPLTAKDPELSPLTRALSEAKIDTVVVAGLATDYCVKASALAAVEEGRTRGWKVLVVREAVKGIDAEQSRQALADLESKGAKIVAMAGEELKALCKKL